MLRFNGSPTTLTQYNTRTQQYNTALAVEHRGQRRVVLLRSRVVLRERGGAAVESRRVAQ